MKIHWEKLLPLLLVLFLSLLAGRYLGGVYLFVYRALATLLLGDILLFILGWHGLRFNQDFSSEHLSRGETIDYELYVQQSRSWTANRVALEFYRLQLDQALYPDRLEMRLFKGSKEERRYSVTTATRGIYQAGLQKVTLFDGLGLCEIPLQLFPRTFYVYPKIYNPQHQAPPGLSMEGEGNSQGHHGNDMTFQNLQEYRPGMDLKAISWKHFARTGRPLLKEQGIHTSRNRVILLDRRPLPRHREDLLLENALAYISSRRNQKDPLQLAGFASGQLLEIAKEKDWESLLKGTLTMKFQAKNLLDLDLPEDQPITLVSGLTDSALLEAEFWKSRSHWQLMALMEGMDEKESHWKRNRLEKLQGSGVDIIIIEKGEEFWSAAIS